MKKVGFLLSIFIFIAIVFYITRPSKIINEIVFYKSPTLELKLVKIKENLLFHYNGDSLRVQCKSDKTKGFSQTKYNKKGWREYVPIQTEIINELSVMKTDIKLKKLVSAAKMVIKFFLMTQSFYIQDLIYL